ncbi:S1C family serine protease [Natronoarchaeum mannanilyticum]|uniref:Trypsin-like peptidase domain-containing protein n=1 Tax=Natronoarchaeum mannanilyticum TaxID=926360 RepID=A0AAV3T7T9_9EURY
MGQGRFALGVALLVVIGTVAAGAVAAPTNGGASSGNQASEIDGAALQADATDDSGTATNENGSGTNDGPNGTTTATRSPGVCDYAGLYDRTIDSVVAIQTGTGIGSGFVYRVADDGTGYVVTNAHVVGDSEEVVVQLADGESRTGEVVGRDVLSDLAVIEIPETPDDAEALPVADGTADPGNAVAALGNPFGLDETITHGIVSGVNRSMPTTRGYSVPNVVQTDAPISPGNSGGPLVTCDGTVVGVNTAGIAARGAENIGFAVSATLIDRVVPALIEDGEYEYSYLGVAATPVTPPIAEANDLNVTEGLYVVRTAEDSPAADALDGATENETAAGFSVPVGGDVIVAIDGQPVSSGEELSSYLVTETSPGDEVTLTVLRDGERQEIEVTLAERPEPQTGPTGQPPGGPPG